MASRKRKALALPDSLCVIPNADKGFHEKWEEGRAKLNFPHPWRGCFTGPPNTGKSTAVKNIIVRSDPPFKRVMIIHADPENSEEYNDLGKDGVQLVGTIPPPDKLNKDDEKMLVVIDDLELKELSREQRRNLDRLVGYVSTHKNVSVAICTQDWFNLPPIVRRCCNVWVIWKSPDPRNMKAIGQRIGAPALPDVASHLLPEFRDSLWVDMTAGTPYPFRKNGFEIINKP
jgi:hypothetical protein